jgi:putative peptide zinc metalloprotease protein
MRKTIAVLAAAAVAAVAAGLPGAARAEGADNVVVATNTRDGSTVFRVSLKIVRTNGDTVDTGNVAVAAAAGCTGCTTVAIALEGVLMFETPHVFEPTNMAIAINVDCDHCDTLASAYQDVLQTGGPVHFTADGNRRLAAIRHALHELRHSDLSIWEIQARADQLANELADVLSTELVPAGGS